MFNGAGIVTGTPGVPGLYDFFLTARDSAVPPHVASELQSFRVNRPFDLVIGEFVAFAAAKPVDRFVASAGGTAPFVTSFEHGALPDGVFVPADTLRFRGIPDRPGSTPCRLTITDVAGTTRTRSTPGVVSAPIAPATQATGT